MIRKIDINYNINIELLDFNKLSINDIITKYAQNNKKIMHSDICGYLISEQGKEKFWTEYIRKIKKGKN